MPTFDPIATATVRKADHLEPAFVHAHNVEVAKRKLGGRRKPPNILIYLMDDVGWGDFGCYGGGVAVGAPTPNFDKLARQGLQLTSCYSEPSCSPSRATLHTGRVPNRHGLHRPPVCRARHSLLAVESSVAGDPGVVRFKAASRA